jgi:hypothetical protein
MAQEDRVEVPRVDVLLQRAQRSGADVEGDVPCAALVLGLDEVAGRG